MDSIPSRVPSRPGPPRIARSRSAAVPRPFHTTHGSTITTRTDPPPPTSPAADHFFSASFSCHSEIPKTSDATSQPARVFYDADCALCRTWANRTRALFRSRGFILQPLQHAVASGRYNIPPEEFLREMKLLRPDGRWLGGIDAWIELASSVVWLRPLAHLARLPVLHTLGRHLYARLAAHRSCIGNRCRLRPGRPVDRSLPLLLLPSVVLFAGNRLESWIWMWLMAGSL